MRRVLLLTVILVSQLAFGNQLSGYLYKSEVDGKEVSLSFDNKTSSYIFRSGGKSYNYPRWKFEDIEKRHYFDIPSKDTKELFKSLRKHAEISTLSSPTDEELVIYNLKTLEKINDYMAPQTGPCNQNKVINSRVSAEYEKSDKEDHQIVELALEGDGFFAMGKLTGFKLELMTSNDNPLHGGLSAMGLTSWGKGIEGNDRGKTFGIGGEVSAEFEKGEITLRKFSEGYSRLGSVEGNGYMYNGKMYKSKLYYDEEGKLYQEFLSIDGIELELKRELGFDDVYVKVIGRKKEMNDTSGIAKSLQEGWHKNLEGAKDNTVQYSYLDYMEKRKGYEAYVEVGKNFELYRGNNSAIDSTIYTGIQGSTLGSSERFVTVGGEVRAVFLDENEGTVFPKWDVRVYGQAKKYEDRETGVISGASLTRRFSVTERGYIYIKAAADYNVDRYSKEYGNEEVERNGRYDIDHKLGIGYEYKFK